MAFIEGTAPTFDTFEDGHRRFFRILRRFVIGAPEIDDVAFTGAGNGPIGKIDTYADSPVEDWTVTFTDATNFDVSGSVSGSQAAGTVGANYDNGIIAFRINAGGTAFEADDEFVIELKATDNPGGTDAWVEDRYNPHSSNLEWIAHGTGLAGSDAIYVGTRMSETPASNQWAMEIRGFTGFDSNLAFTAQPGVSPIHTTLLWNQTHPYWIAVNGRRWTFTARVSTVYYGAYAGFILPYNLPSEYPYPLLIGGSGTTTNTAWTDTSGTRSMYWHPQGSQAAGSLRLPSGSWGSVTEGGNNIVVWPNYQNNTTNANAAGEYMELIETANAGEYPLFPMILCENVQRTVPRARVIHGELDGIYAVPGFNLSPEDTLSLGGDDYVVMQNIYLTTRGQKAAIKKA